MKANTIRVALVLLSVVIGTTALAQTFPEGIDFRNYDTDGSTVYGVERLYSNSEPQMQSPTPLIVSLEINPPNPGPGDRVNIKVVTYSTDLNQAIISWLENGELVKTGLGLREYTATAGPIGSSKIVTVIIRASDGYVHEENIPIRPAVVDIMWESPSTVPPFYKGKALYPMLGTIRIVAFPYMVDDKGNVIDPKNMVYTWRKNGRVVGDRSGYQRRVITFDENDSIYRLPFEIKLVVSDADGKYFAEKKIEINGNQQDLFFYENNPVFGTLYNKSLGNQFALKEKELSLEASPYFMDSPSRRDGQMRYLWTINQDTYTKYGEPIITFRNDNTTAGRTDVSLELYNDRKILEGAREGISIYFNAVK